MLSDNHFSHYITRRRCMKTLQHKCNFAEYTADIASNHEKLGGYSVRYESHDEWFDVLRPDQQAVEWVYFDDRGIPLLYWNAEANAVVLLG